MDFTGTAAHRVKVKVEKQDKKLEPCLRAEEAVEHERVSNPNSSWNPWNNIQ